jgi:DNA polymerase-3 subunit delta
MTKFHYKAFKPYIDTLEKSQIAPVYLLYGEEYLYKSSANALLKKILPGSEREAQCLAISGENENIPKTIEQINTYSLLSDVKVVLLTEAKLFYAKKNRKSFMKMAKAAYDQDDLEKAAKHFIALLSAGKFTLDDAKHPHRAKTFADSTHLLDDGVWLDRIVDYCENNHLSPYRLEDKTNLLYQALEKGFPSGHHLIITTDTVNKGQKIYKLIETVGVVVDCFVPKGDRKADRQVQETVLKEKMRAFLIKRGKQAQPDVFAALYDRTGFDLRNFMNNLEKLIDFVGDRKQITAADVRAISRRTKTDPIYALTNAVAERDVTKALFYLQSLLEDNFHPLQVLTAICNQVRKLLLMKDFAIGVRKRISDDAVSYDQFKRVVMPEIVACDNDLIEQMVQWESLLSAPANLDDTEKKPGKIKKSRTDTDLIMAKNPNSPYPLFLLFQKCQQFRLTQLIDALAAIGDADLQLKSSGQNPRLVLERLLLGICT